MSKLITEQKTIFPSSFRPSSRIDKTPASVTREILKVIDSPDIISFAGGLPDDSLFPIDELTEIFQSSVLKKGAKLFQYSDTQGHSDLRAWIAERYYPGSTPEEIILTNGSQQALDLLSRYFIEEGSNIILERPSYLGAIQVFSSYSPNFLGIDLEQNGPDTNLLNRILKQSQEKPKFFYCIPDFQNPSGTSYSNSIREEIVSVCRSNQVPIVEDTAYRELDFEGNIPISLCSMDPGNTISIGTFSKTLSPGLRTGWIRGPKLIIRDLLVQKQSMDLHSPLLNQELVYHFVSSSKYEPHLSKIRNVYKKKGTSAYLAFKEKFGNSICIEPPKGGLFLWLEFSEYMDTDILFKKCMKAGLAFVPGSSFYVNEVSRKHLRWNFSNASDEAAKEGVARLFDVVRKNSINFL